MRQLGLSIVICLAANMASAAPEAKIADAGQLYFPGDGGKPPINDPMFDSFKIAGLPHYLPAKQS